MTLINLNYYGRSGEWGKRGQHLIALRSEKEIHERSNRLRIRDYFGILAAVVAFWVFAALVMGAGR